MAAPRFVMTTLQRDRAPGDLARDWLVLNRAPAPVPIPGPMPQDLFDGTAGNDDITGTAGDDGFDMGQGGNDTVNGKAGMDIFLFEDTFTAQDSINGGSHPDASLIEMDALYLNGDYSSGVVFGANTVTNVENIYLTTANSYRFVLHDNTVKDDAIMAIRGGTLGAADDLTVDNSDSSSDSGNLLVYAGAGKDKLTGGGSNETVLFTDETLQKSDRIDGGGFIDSIVLDGDFSGGFTFGAKTFRKVENLYTTHGNDYVLTVVDENVAPGDRLVVYGSPLDTGSSLTFDGSAERDGYFLLLGGDDHDELIGGRGNDDLYGGGSGDTLVPGPGNDLIVYTGPSQSGGSRYDMIHGFDFDGVDRFQMDFVPSAIDDTINTGTLSPLSFEADLAAAVNDGNLAPGHAVLFRPDEGLLAGERFLIVDVNGVAGWQSGGVDLVVRLIDARHLSSLDTADFIPPF
jgi:Ca2+-binding RTX toxin-like protein